MAQPRLEEQIVAQAIALGLLSQLSGAEGIDVNVQTDLLQLIQGQAASLSISGTGLVIPADFSIQELELQANGVGINPLSSLFGKLELSQPIDVSLRLVLTEADLQRALNAQSLLRRLFPQKFQVGPQTVSVTLQPPLDVTLPGQGKMALQGGALVEEPQQTYTLHFSLVLQHRGVDQPIRLEDFHCQPGEGFSLDLALEVIRRLQAIGQRQGIESRDMLLKIKDLQIHTGHLTLEADVRLYPTILES